MNETFYLGRSYRNVAIVGLLVGLGTMVAFVCVAANDGRAFPGLVFAGLAAFYIGINVWMLLVYWRESLCIHDGNIVQKGVLRTKSLALSDLIDLQWRIPGAIVLCSKSGKIRVDLDSFELDQQQQLIRLFRLSTSSIQRGWDRFCYIVAMPLWKGSGACPLRDGEVLITRRHFDWRYLPVIGFAVVISIGVAWYRQGSGWLWVPVPFLTLWCLLRIATPARGVVEKRLWISQAERCMLLVLLETAVAIMGMCLFSIFWPRLYFWAWPGIFFCFCFLLVQGYLLGRQSRRDEREKVEIAVQDWERQEAGRINSPNSKQNDGS